MCTHPLTLVQSHTYTHSHSHTCKFTCAHAFPPINSHTYVCAHNAGIGSSSGVQALSSCIHPQGFTTSQWNTTPQSPKLNTHNQLLVGCKVSELGASWQG